MKRTLRCVYCGQSFPDGTPVSQDDTLYAHIRICEKHPLRAAEAAIREMCAALHQIEVMAASQAPRSEIEKIAGMCLAKYGPTVQR